MPVSVAHQVVVGAELIGQLPSKDEAILFGDWFTLSSVPAAPRVVLFSAFCLKVVLRPKRRAGPVYDNRSRRVFLPGVRLAL